MWIAVYVVVIGRLVGFVLSSFVVDSPSVDFGSVVADGCFFLMFSCTCDDSLLGNDVELVLT